MEKTIKWEVAESAQMRMIENERTQVLAQIGALMMDLETAKKALETVNARHKSAIQQALATRGVGHFESARPIQDGVIINIPEQKEIVNGPTNP